MQRYWYNRETPHLWIRTTTHAAELCHYPFGMSPGSLAAGGDNHGLVYQQRLGISLDRIVLDCMACLACTSRSELFICQRKMVTLLRAAACQLQWIVCDMRSPWQAKREIHEYTQRKKTVLLAWRCWASVSVPLGDCVVQGLPAVVWWPLAQVAQAVKDPEHGQECFTWTLLLVDAHPYTCQMVSIYADWSCHCARYDCYQTG